MPPAPSRTLIGYRRRVPLNHATPKSRGRHLNCSEVGYRHALQTCILSCEGAATETLHNIHQLLLVKAVAVDTDLDLEHYVDNLISREIAKFH